MTIFRNHVGMVLSVILMGSVLAGCDSPEEKERAHFQNGVELYNAESSAKAMIEFRNTLRLNPKNADALYYVGLIHERAQRWPQAYAAYQAAVSERPEFKDAQDKLGTLALTGGDLDTAAASAAAILEHHPDDPDGRILDAAVLLRQGDVARADQFARSVLSDDPTHENAIAVIIGVYNARGQVNDAVAFIDESLKQLPESTSLRLLKLILLDEEGDVDGVLAVYNELFELDPENSQYRLALANYHSRQNNVDQAEAVLRDAMDQQGDEDGGIARSLIVLIYNERGIEAAQSEAAKLLEANPDNHSIRFLMAEFYARNEQRDDAERLLLEIAESGSTDDVLDAKASLARLKLAGDDPEGAAALADEVIEENGEHRGANFVRGLIDLQNADYDAAIRHARTALREDNTWVPALKLAAEAHIKMGEYDIAANALQEVIALQPHDIAAAEALAMLQTQSGDVEAARKVWDQIIEYTTDPGKALQARAQIEIQQENWSSAQRDINALLGLEGHEAYGALLSGNLNLARGDTGDGREWYAKALSIDPDQTQSLIGVVRSYLAEGNTDAALVFLDSRIAEKSDDSVAYNIKGELLAQTDRLDESADAFQQTISLQPDWLAPYRRLGALYASEERFDEAVSIYEQGLEAIPDNSELLMDLAGTYLMADQPQEAIDIYDRELKINSENDVASNNFAALVADYRYQDESALELASQRTDGFRTSDNPYYLDTLGWLNYRKGDIPVAITYLQRALAHAPENDAQMRYHLGMALYADKDLEQARVELQKAVAGDADYEGLEEARSTLEVIQANSQES